MDFPIKNGDFQSSWHGVWLGVMETLAIRPIGSEPIPSATNVCAPWRPSPHRQWSDKIPPHIRQNGQKIRKLLRFSANQTWPVNFLMFFSFDLGTKLKTCNTYWPKVSGWHCAILCFFYVVTFKKLGWTVMDRGGHSWSCLLNSLPSECQRYLELISPWDPNDFEPINCRSWHLSP